MNINWKCRLKNKATLAALIGAVVALIYQILGILGVVPKVSQDAVMQAIGIIINVLVALGVVVDPTTAGVSDSAEAMTYTEPRKVADGED